MVSSECLQIKYLTLQSAMECAVFSLQFYLFKITSVFTLRMGEVDKRYYEKHREKILAKQHTEEYRKKRREYMKMKRATDPRYSRVGKNRFQKTPKPGFTVVHHKVIIYFD